MRGLIGLACGEGNSRLAWMELGEGECEKSLRRVRAVVVQNK
jgi:hypothetical protein